MVWSFSNAAAVYWNGLRACAGLWIPVELWDALRDAFRGSPLTAAAAAALPFAVFATANRREPPTTAPRRALWLGLAIFILGYLPIAVSGYTPAPYTEVNRVNQVPAVGCVVFLVALAAQPAAAWAEGALAVVAAAMLAAHVAFAQRWAQSYRLQCDTRDLVRKIAPAWPRGAELLLLPKRYYVDRSAPVFIAHWASPAPSKSGWRTASAAPP